MLSFYVLSSVFITSFISGAIGIGGGSILMGIFLSFFPVELSMVLHGMTQLTANGSRAFFLKDYIRYSILPTYFIGIIPVLAAFYFFKFVPSKGLIFFLLGVFPFISMALRKLNVLNLSIENAFHAFLCGVNVTIIQLTAGASGVVLTEFYIHSSLNRKEIVATESFTQSSAHLFKLIYFILIMSSLKPLLSIPPFLYPAIIVISILGTWCGKKVLLKLSDKNFKTIAKLLIRSIAIIFLVKGVRLLWEI